MGGNGSLKIGPINNVYQEGIVIIFSGYSDGETEVCMNSENCINPHFISDRDRAQPCFLNCISDPMVCSEMPAPKFLFWEA